MVLVTLHKKTDYTVKNFDSLIGDSISDTEEKEWKRSDVNEVRAWSSNSHWQPGESGLLTFPTHPHSLPSRPLPLPLIRTDQSYTHNFSPPYFRALTGPHVMSSVIDLEAQKVAQAAPRSGDVEGAEMREMDKHGPHTRSLPSSLRSVSAGQDININEEARPAISQAEGSRVGDTPEEAELNISGDGLTQAEAEIPADIIPTLDPGPRNTSESKEPRMIGDFDGSANEFWKLYRDEAQSHDDATISTLKDGMDSALIFAGLFSAVLTAFVIDSQQNLKPSPSDETVYYLRQHSTILSQISVQLSSIAPQVVIPSTPPPPFPSFSPLISDIRVNVFWFMALAFSLLAALLAILVQQWVRNYMHVFQRYGDPLKSSRLRQYLYEGCKRWKMPRVAEAVPGFLHVSLFLFFAGLGDSLLNINSKVALTTIIPIGISGLLYIFTILAPIIYPQSPYQNIFSGILWYVIQKSRGRRFRDHGFDGEMRPVSANMAQGQMQLAMEETMARKNRDVGATRWLIDNLTEDAEMEKFISALPGSFNSDWGTEVWKRVGEHHESEDQSQDETVARPGRDTAAHQPSSSSSVRSIIRPIIHLFRKHTFRHPPSHASTPNVHVHSTIAHIHGEDVVHELSTRVARSVEICKNRGLFANDDLWRKRTRACVEATASLVCCTNAKIDWFGGISKLLGQIGSSEKIRELSLAGTDELFVTRWTCLSLVAIRPILADDEFVQRWVREALESFAKEDDSGNNDALATSRKIDETLKKANHCLYRLFDALHKTEDLTEVKEILRDHESEISELEQINIEADRLEWADIRMYHTQNSIEFYSYQIFPQFPGVLDDFDLDYEAPIPFSRMVELSRDPRRLQFIRPRQILKSMCSPSLTLRDILEGQAGADAFKGLQKNSKIFLFFSWHGDEMKRQLCRLQDLRDGSGLGFTVELFFLALSQLLSTSSSNESHSALYTGTFQAITSDWSKHKDSIGTQKFLLSFAVSRLEAFVYDYPSYIVDEFLLLLGKIFEGQTGPHIDSARQELESVGRYLPTEFMEKVLRVLTRGRVQSPASKPFQSVFSILCSLNT